MARDQLVERLDQAVHKRKPAEPGDGSQTWDRLRDPEHRLGAGNPATVWFHDVQSRRECGGLDARRELRELARNPLGGHEAKPPIAVEVPQALDRGEAYPALAVVADDQAGSRRKILAPQIRISSSRLQPMKATMAVMSRYEP